MAIGCITTMACCPEDVVDAMLNSGVRPHRSTKWEPPQYSSLRAWMFMNYLLLALLLALPALIVIAVIR